MKKIYLFSTFAMLFLSLFFYFKQIYSTSLLEQCKNKLLFYHYQWEIGGKNFPFEKIEKLPIFNFSDKESYQFFKNKSYSIFFLVRDVDCNLCVQKTITFLDKLNKKRFFIGGIISLLTSNKLYVSRFLKINKIKFPTWYDEKNQIFNYLSITTGPAIILIDNSNQKIIFVAILSPTNKKEVENFFDFLKRLSK